MTSPVRSVEVPALLIAVTAFGPCEIVLAPDDPRMLELAASAGARRGRTRAFRSDDSLEIEFEDRRGGTSPSAPAGHLRAGAGRAGEHGVAYDHAG